MEQTDLGWRADSRTGYDNPFAVGRGEDDLSPDNLWLKYLQNPHEYADIRTRHPELPLAPTPPRNDQTPRPASEFTPNLGNRLGEEGRFLETQNLPQKAWHAMIDPIGLGLEAMNTAGHYLTGVAAYPYQQIQEARPDVDVGKAISGGFNRLRQEGPGALRDAPGAVLSGTQAFLQGAATQSSPYTRQPFTADEWGARQRPPINNIFDPTEAMQRLDWYAPGPWKELASLPAGFLAGSPGTVLKAIPVAGALAKILPAESLAQTALTGMKAGLEGISHAAMPGLNIAQPIVGNTNPVSILKALRYKGGPMIGAEQEFYDLPKGTSVVGPELEKFLAVQNQAERLRQNIPTGIGRQVRDPVTGELSIPEESYAWKIGGHAGQFIDRMRSAWTDTSAPIQTLVSWAERTGGLRFGPNDNPQAMLEGIGRASREATTYRIHAMSTLAKDFAIDNERTLADWYAWRNLDIQKTKIAQGKPDPNLFAVRGQQQRAENHFLDRMAEHYGGTSDDIRTWFEGAGNWYTQEVMNPLLYRLRDSGFLTDEQVANAVNKYDHYATLERVGLYNDKIGSGAMGDHPAGRGIGHFHPELTPSKASPEADMQHIQNVFHAVQHNDAINALSDMRTVVPELEAQHLLYPLVPLGNQYTSQVAKSIGRVPYYDKITKEYRELGVEPELAHAINGATEGQANAVIRFMQASSRIFQTAVTTMNPTFLPGHWSRTTSSIIENMPAGEAAGAAFLQPGAMMTMILPQPAKWLEQHAAHASGMDQRVSSFISGIFKKQGYDPAALEEFTQYGPHHASEILLGPAGITGTREIMKRAGMELDNRGVGDVLSNVNVIKKYKDGMEMLFNLADEVPRFAAFKTLRNKGTLPEEAGTMVANMGVNFARSGSVIRAMNTVMPLLNARVQGQLTSLHGLWENPQRFAFRSAWLVGVPEMVTYAHNRNVMGDMYDQISPEEKMRNYIIGTGGVMKDARGHEQPTYISIPKTPLVQIMSAPMNQMLDSVYHQSAGALPEQYKDQFPDHPYFKIPENQRTGQSAQHLFMGMLGRVAPTDVTGVNEAHELFDQMAILSMVPLVSVATQMWANKDHFTGRPIVPPELENVPPEYRYTPNTSETSKAISRFLGQNTPVGKLWHLEEPARLESLVSGYLGGTGELILGGSDQLWGEMARHGLVPPPDSAPHSWQDLRLPKDIPEDVKWQYMKELNSPEREPWGPAFLKKIVRFLGTGGAAQTDISRAARYGEDAQKVVEDTRGYFADYAAARARMQNDITKKAENLNGMSPEDFRKFETDQYAMLRGVGTQLREKYQKAKLDPKEYRAFMAQIPGVNLQEMQSALPKLPAGLAPENILEQVLKVSDPTIDPAMQNPLVRYQRQQQEFGNIARTYQIPVGVVKDHAAAKLAEKTLPEIPVPNIGIQLARDEYYHPKDIDFLTSSPKEIAQARDRVVDHTAGDWGVDRQTVLEMLNTSFRDPFMSSPLQKSRETATSLTHELYDEQRFPKYVNPKGLPLGDHEQHMTWDLLLAQYQSNPNIKREQWPAMVQQIDAAKRYADVYKEIYMMNDPRYADYQMWYGTGRNVPIEDWAKYQSGQELMYRAGTPAQQRVWDALQKIYGRLPQNDPNRAAMKPTIDQIRKLAVPHWRDLLLAQEALAG